MRAGSYLPTQRGTSSASLRAAAPDRRPHTAPGLLQRSRTGRDGSRLTDCTFVLTPSERKGTEAPVVTLGAVGLSKTPPCHQVVLNKHAGFKRPAADLA